MRNGFLRGVQQTLPFHGQFFRRRTDEWVQIIKDKRKSYSGRSEYGLFREVYKENIKRGAEKFMPLFEASEGKLGHISGQVDPNLIKDSAAMIEMAEELADLSPNVMIKISASTQGIPVFRHLASKGIANKRYNLFQPPPDYGSCKCRK